MVLIDQAIVSKGFVKKLVGFSVVFLDIVASSEIEADFWVGWMGVVDSH